MTAFATRAALYRRTAQSIRKEIATGVVHCVCCLVPEAECVEAAAKKGGAR